MTLIDRLRRYRPPVWRIAAAVLAAFLLVIGGSRIVAARAGTSGNFGPIAACIGAAEMIGGAMLLIPGVVSHAAFLLAPFACLTASIDSSATGLGMAATTAILLVSLVSLGYARRPRALLKARLDRAVERVVRIEASRAEGAQRENS